MTPGNGVVTRSLPRIEIVTLTHNSERYVDAYFRALAAVDYPSERLRLTLLDNASTDGTVTRLKQHSEDAARVPVSVQLEVSSTNLGFAAGNNLVLRQLLKEARADFVLLLNPDTEIDSQCISRLLETMRSDSRIGLVEARQTPREHPKWYDPITHETGWCSGGGVLVRCEALREVGLFDAKFFLYCEDVDLSWRMWLRNWKCLINPEAVYRHYTEDLDEARDRKVQLFYTLRNSFFMHLKYDSWKGLRQHTRFFNQVMNAQSDPELRAIYSNAKRAYYRFVPQLLWDRVRLGWRKKSPWIVFDGFNFERRRSYTDTADGGRIVYDS